MDRYDTDRLIWSRCVALLRSIFEAIKQSVVETDPVSVREFRQRIGQHIDLLHLNDALTDEMADAHGPSFANRVGNSSRDNGGSSYKPWTGVSSSKLPTPSPTSKASGWNCWP